jgi:hypothetical protein
VAEKVAPDGSEDCRDIRFAHVGAAQDLGVAPAGALDDRGEQGVLAGEVGIDRRLRDSGRLRHGIHARRAESLLEKHRGGGVEDLFGLRAALDGWARDGLHQSSGDRHVGR